MTHHPSGKPNDESDRESIVSYAMQCADTAGFPAKILAEEVTRLRADCRQAIEAGCLSVSAMKSVMDKMLNNIKHLKKHDAEVRRKVWEEAARYCSSIVNDGCEADAAGLAEYFESKAKEEKC